MTMTITSQASVANLFDQFLAEYSAAGEHITSSAKFLAQAFDANAAEAAALVKRQFPDWNARTLKRILQVGRGKVHYKLLAGASDGGAALSRCDIAVQTYYLENPVEVAEPDQPTEHRLISIAELSQKQARQVFGYGEIRSLAAQRTWLQEHAPRKIKPVEQVYTVSRKGITMHPHAEPLLLTRANLLDMAREIPE